MYTKIGEISEACRQALLERLPRFTQIGGKPEQEANYKTTSKLLLENLDHAELRELVPMDRWEKSIAVRIEPGGKLHRHIHDKESCDQGRTRYQVVLETNGECESANGDFRGQLEDRGVYHMQPYLPHEAQNRGETDRTHLVLVTLDV